MSQIIPDDERWWLDFDEEICLPNHVGVSSDSHGLLAQVVWKFEDDERTPRCETNANLIVALPIMLMELRNVVRVLRKTDDHSDIPVERISNLIKEITGEEI